jgi:hypothetical protein
VELKPRFQHRFNGAKESAEEKIEEALQRPESICRGGIREGFLVLSVRDERPHFWSPQLRARILDEDPSTLIRGRFAPKPDTWTMFIAIYAAVVFSTGVGAVFGLAQLSLGSDPWALWSIPVGLALVGCVWLGARLGQELGAEDMQTLSTFVRETLDDTKLPE